MPFEGERTAPRIIRDPIYGYISVDERLASVVDHPLVQRLRRIGQTSLTSTVYPSANGSRFEHALGTMHLARWGWDAAWRNTLPEVRESFRLAVCNTLPALGLESSDDIQQLCGLAVAGVGLLHDIGHPPFSHVLEGFYASMADQHLGPEAADWDQRGLQYHEFVGMKLTELVLDVLPEPLKKVTWEVYTADPDGFTWAGALHAIVAGEIDVDRVDYLMRDAQKAGTEFGELDYRRLMDALELHRDADGRFRIAPGIRARSAVETLLLQRSQSYKWITFHPRVVGSNRALEQAMAALRKLASDLSETSIGDEATDLSSIFSEAMSPLNYMRPGVQETLAAAGLPLEEQEAPGQLAFTEQAQTQLADRLKLELQASVDDATVIRALQQASLCAQGLLGAATLRPEQQRSLNDFVTLGGAALYRRKNYLPVWKTVEAFSSVSERMQESLLSAVGEGFDEARRLIDDDAVREELAARETQLRQLLEQRPVVGANHLFQKLLPHARYREQLLQELNTTRASVKGAEGFWDLVLTSFRPLRTRGQLAGLYSQERFISMRESSPLVRALEDVEAHRNKLVVLFFLRHPVDFTAWDAMRTREAREDLAASFIQVFPKFVGGVLGQFEADAYRSS